MIMTRRSVLCVLLVPCVFALARVAPAQDDEGDEVEEAPQNGVRLEQEIGPEVIDQWLFPQGNEKSARDFLESQLALRTEELQRLCQLSEAQVRKLQLAGRTEIKRLFDRIQEFRRKFEEQRMKRRDLGQVWQEVQPLRALIMSGQFGERSLFAKVAQRTLTAEQAPAYRRQAEQRRAFRRRAQSELFLMLLDKQTPLREEQRERLRELLKDVPPVRGGQYEAYALMATAAKVPAKKYRDALDEPQWKALSRLFDHTKNMEQWLRQSGALDPEDNANETAAP